MKLATLKDGSRDGQLVVVSRDLATAHHATGVAGTLRQALDDWAFIAPQLQDLYATLNDGKVRHAFPFDPRRCMAPLPRPAQWLAAVDGGVEGSGDAPDDRPALLQGGSDDLLGTGDDACFVSADDGTDCEAQLAVITGDVDRATGEEAALDAVRLVTLANAWTLRERVPAERAAGWGLLQSRPAAAFGPVAVTPDEFGEAWQGGRLHGWMQVRVDGREVARQHSAHGMRHHFGRLIAHVAATRRLRVGSLIGAGVPRNADPAFGSGAGSLAALRAAEAAASGAAVTPWLAFGQHVHIEWQDDEGRSVLGALAQVVAPWHRDAP